MKQDKGAGPCRMGCYTGSYSQDVGDDSNRPAVHRLAVGFLRQNFRRWKWRQVSLLSLTAQCLRTVSHTDRLPYRHIPEFHTLSTWCRFPPSWTGRSRWSWPWSPRPGCSTGCSRAAGGQRRDSCSDTLKAFPAKMLQKGQSTNQQSLKADPTYLFFLTRT